MINEIKINKYIDQKPDIVKDVSLFGYDVIIKLKTIKDIKTVLRYLNPEFDYLFTEDDATYYNKKKKIEIKRREGFSEYITPLPSNVVFDDVLLTPLINKYTDKNGYALTTPDYLKKIPGIRSSYLNFRHNLFRSWTDDNYFIVDRDLKKIYKPKETINYKNSEELYNLIDKSTSRVVDLTSWYSCTVNKIGRYIAKILLYRSTVMYELFSNVGNLARTILPETPEMHVNDINKDILRMARFNLAIMPFIQYGLKYSQISNNKDEEVIDIEAGFFTTRLYFTAMDWIDCIEYNKKNIVEEKRPIIIIMDPPYGGEDYEHELISSDSLTIGDYTLRDGIMMLYHYNKEINFIIALPKNILITSIPRMFPPTKNKIYIEKMYVGSIIKQYIVFYGPFFNYGLH